LIYSRVESAASLFALQSVRHIIVEGDEGEAALAPAPLEALASEASAEKLVADRRARPDKHGTVIDDGYAHNDDASNNEEAAVTDGYCGTVSLTGFDG